MVFLMLAVGCSSAPRSGKVNVIGMVEGDFQSPAAFDGSGCEGDWDKQSLDGTIWNIDHTFPSNVYAGVVRFDGAVATYNGFAPAATVLDGKKLFWYRAETPRATQRSFYACTRPAPGQIDGAVVSCTMMGGCAVGTFHAVKLERRAGEGDAAGLTELAEFPFPESITANVRVDAAR